MEPTYIHNGQYEVLPSNLYKGRSGIPLLARDVQTGETVFIKRTDIYSLDAEIQNQDLKNEAAVLREMAGYGVPTFIDEFIEHLPSDYGTKEIHYLVMEYVGDGEWVNNNYSSIPYQQRIEIIYQLFTCLAFAHDKRIANGDIDAKHLVWRSTKNQLVIIDWGNAKQNVEDNSAYLFDLARAAEIVYLLFTLESFPLNLSTPLLKFSDDVPQEFYQLCEWARNPNKEPTLWTAKKLQEIARGWNSEIVTQLVEQADYAYYSGEFEKSIDFYHEALNKDPKNKRVQAQIRKAEYNKLSQKSLDTIPNEALVEYSRARSYLATGMWNEAIKALKKAIKIAEQAGKEYSGAIELLESVEVDRENAAAAEIHRNNALAALDSEQWFIAISHLEKALAINPNNFAAKTLLEQLRSLLKARSLVEQLIADIGNKSTQEKHLAEIEKTILDTSESPFLSVLWREVVKGLGELKKKPAKNNALSTLIWASIVSFAIILLVFSLVYLLPHQTIVVDCNKILSGLSVSLSYPTYLANGDDAELQITLLNDSSNSQSISGSILVNFVGTANVHILDSAGSNVIDFPTLNPGQQLSHSIHFAINEPVEIITNPNQYVDFSIRPVGASDSCVPNNLHIATAPIYGLRKVITVLWSTLGITVVGLFWQQIKKQIGLE